MTTRRRRRWANASAAAVALGVALTARGARAQVDEAVRISARELGDEAGALFQAGDYAAALAKYERADALVHVPTLGVRAARCLAKLGRWVEASERYLAVTRMPLGADAPPVHLEAKQQAAAERAALVPRLPYVVLDVAGGADGAEVFVDGKRIPPALVGIRQPIDPGEHRAEARRAGAVGRATFVSREAETHRVTIALDATAQSASAAPAPAAPPPPDAAAGARGGSTQRSIGWIALGIGSAGVAAGAVLGAIALGDKSDLEARCPDGDCPPSAWEDNNAYGALRTGSTIGLWGGGALAVAGVVLVVTAPSGAPARAASFSPWFGIARAGVRGAF